MATFMLQVPVTGYEIYEIEGGTLEEALENANDPGYDLPPEPYALNTTIDGSFEPVPGF